jgi:hypothetical protein
MEIPFADIGKDEVLQEWIAQIDRVCIENKNGEQIYRIQRSQPKRIASSPLVNQNSVVKRSRSAPSKDDDEVISSPNQSGRQSRSVRFQQDPRTKNNGSITSTPSTRSRSETRPTQSLIVRTLNQFTYH